MRDLWRWYIRRRWRQWGSYRIEFGGIHQDDKEEIEKRKESERRKRRVTFGQGRRATREVLNNRLTMKTRLLSDGGRHGCVRIAFLSPDSPVQQRRITNVVRTRGPCSLGRFSRELPIERCYSHGRGRRKSPFHSKRKEARDSC